MSKNLRRLLLMVLMLSIEIARGVKAQQLQRIWSFSTSQGVGRSSGAVQVVRSTAVNPGPQLTNAESTGLDGQFRILNPSQDFSVLESTETNITTTNTNSSGFSQFSGIGTSVFHTPVSQ